MWREGGPEAEALGLAQSFLRCVTVDKTLGVTIFHLSNGLLQGPNEVMGLFRNSLIQQIFIQHLLHTRCCFCCAGYDTKQTLP